MSTFKVGDRVRHKSGREGPEHELAVVHPVPDPHGLILFADDSGSYRLNYAGVYTKVERVPQAGETWESLAGRAEILGAYAYGELGTFVVLKYGHVSCPSFHSLEYFTHAFTEIKP